MCCWLLLPPSDRSYRPVWSVADVAQREWREYLLFADWDVIRPYGVVGGQWDKSGTMTASPHRAGTLHLQIQRGLPMLPFPPGGSGIL